MILLEGYLKGKCEITTPCDRVVSAETLDENYDFIVVGGGSAGSIVAGRLSENKNNKVLLLEAGGEEPIGARVPSLYRAFMQNDEITWGYRTVPEGYCLEQGNKGCVWPRGKVLGGSSVLNGMMYHRGHAADFEDWVDARAKGWSWEDNYKYFLKTEGNKQIGSVVSSDYHNSDGPLPIQQFRHQPPFVYEILNAVNETGLPVIADMNDPNTVEGFVVAQANNDNGQRYTTARAYLKTNKQRPNLTVQLNTHVTKVIFEGKRAVGVEYFDINGYKNVVKCTKEVILSSGALNSPHILLLSGVGPKETLQKFNIPVVADLPVGKNLRNHYGITMYFVLTKLNNTEVLDWSVLTDYLLHLNGPMSATGITQLTGLLYSRYGERSRHQPDLQFFFNGFYADCSKDGLIGAPAVTCPENGLNISANAAILKPLSVGYLTLNSTDPLEPPLFYPNYFYYSEDMDMIIDGVRYLQKIFNSNTLKNKFGAILDETYTTTCSSSGEEWSDEWIKCMALVHTDPQNHQLGTAAIGAVVDTDLKVFGVDGLRVIDASVMPRQITGNPQTAIMMVAERGAENIQTSWSSY